MTRPITIQVATDTSKVASGFAPLEAALKDIVTEAEQTEEALEDLSDVEIKFDIREQALQRARQDIERLRDQIAKDVVLGVDTKVAERRVSALSSTIRQLDQKKVTVEIDVETEGIDKGVSGMEALRSGTAETANSLGSLGTGLQGVSGFALSAQFALADLSETLADVAERNRQAGIETSRFSKGLGAVAGFAAGPWGIALTAGIALLGVFGASQSDADDAMQAFTDGLDRQAGALDENNRRLAASALEASGALEEAEKLGLSTENLVTALLNGKDARDLWNESLKEGVIAETAVTGAGAQSLTKVQALISAYREASDAGSENIEKDRRIAAAMGETGEAAEQTAKQVEDAIDPWDEYRDTIDDARSKLDGLVDSLDIFSGRVGASKEALADYHKQQRELNEALAAGATGMNVATEAGAKNDQMIRDQAENIADLATARLKDADSSGESSDQILSDYAKQRESLIVMADKLGLSGAEAKKYVDNLLKTPDELKTNVELNGADKAIDTMEEVSKTRYADVYAQVKLDEASLNQAISRMHDAMSTRGVTVQGPFGGPAPFAVAPSGPQVNPLTIMQPRIYLDSQSIGYAMRPAIASTVRSTVDAATRRGRL